jgi:hypothetical protein
MLEVAITISFTGSPRDNACEQRITSASNESSFAVVSPIFLMLAQFLADSSIIFVSIGCNPDASLDRF